MADDAALDRRLSAALAARFGEDCRVTGLARLSGGANSETWRFDLEHEGGREALILRCRPAGVEGEEIGQQIPMEVEAETVARVAEQYGCA